MCVLLLDRRRVYASGGSGMSSGMDDRTVAAHKYSSSTENGDDDVAAASNCRTCGGCGRSSDPVRDGDGGSGVVAAAGVRTAMVIWRSMAMAAVVAAAVVFVRLLPLATTSCIHSHTRFRYTVSEVNISWPHGRTEGTSPPATTAVAAVTRTAPTPTPRFH